MSDENEYTSQNIAITKDNLDSYIKIADNAFYMGDFNNAENYYKAICELQPCDINLSMYDICRFLNGNTEYNSNLLRDVRVLNERTQLLALKNIYNKLLDLMEEDLTKALRFCSTESVRKSRTVDIHNNYKPYFDQVSNQIVKLEPEFRPSHNMSPIHSLSANTIKFIVFCIIAILFIYMVIK